MEELNEVEYASVIDEELVSLEFKMSMEPDESKRKAYSDLLDCVTAWCNEQE